MSQRTQQVLYVAILAVLLVVLAVAISHSTGQSEGP